ncbi:hypothetical protein F4556_004760 [Kitasatospora gansuensis]|uniref:Uncharacterized protein n=1 Tax=Kitasatospora gansuensis TaxID=258050 RepID=A0A7W7SEY2_9ACTN|nr:hypothetical protein [Kitasatospora gansuensis]MBB4949225.1 hypothetical protein [Kitasatospora gansuensis]
MDDQDRPAITTARLDGLFDGLRGELSGLRVPEPEELLGRALRRRRWRRIELTLVAGVLASAGVWGLAKMSDGGGGIAAELVGPPSLRTITPTLVLPGPGSPFGSVETMMPVDATGGQLLLGREQLPVSPGRYGPWGSQLVAASAFALPTLQGCVPELVDSLGALRRWELVHGDVARADVTAVQYLLEFEAEPQAAQAATRLLGTAECTGLGWPAGERAERAAAVGSTGRPGRVEEFTTRLSGRQLAVLTVQYRADKSAESVVLDPEFRVAAEQFGEVGTGAAGPVARGLPSRG